MSHNIWVLGAPDPEMEMIEALLRAAGQQVAYACTAQGRVHPGVAYEATHARWDPDGPPAQGPDAGAVTHLVECAHVDGQWRHAQVIDHHRPGDPGYGLAAARYWAGSSIGQVVDHLYHASVDHPRLLCACGCQMSAARCGSQQGYVVPPEWQLIAAADHCLAAAYRGECLGVDPDDLMRWRIETRARHQGREPSDVLADVERAREMLRARPVSQIAGAPVADCRDVHIPELPEAASREGLAFLGSPIRGDGRKKINLMGGTPEQIQAFLDGEIIPGLMDTYGDPQRGFAGGYH